MAVTRSPARVMAMRPVPGRTPAAVRKYAPNAGWPLARVGSRSNRRPAAKRVAAQKSPTTSRPRYSSGIGGIDLCTQILATETTPAINPRHELPDDELLAALARAQAAAPQIDAAIRDYVEVLRSRGVSWTRIGAALGVSKQAAWERFSGED